MSKWVIDINERWLVHDVFGREEPDDEFVIRYFNSIYGVKSVERFEEVEDAPEEKEKKYEVGDVYLSDNGHCVIITNIDDGYLSCADETGVTDFMEIRSDNDLMKDKFKTYICHMSIADFFKNAETNEYIKGVF